VSGRRDLVGGAVATMKEGRRVRRHSFVGLDRFAYALVARCSCGWSSATHPSEDRALAAFGLHRVASLRGRFRRADR
jgi:hypothetical protein